jgi:hypothetical protein
MSVAVIPGLPAEFASLPGIVMRPPPPIYRAATDRIIENAVKDIANNTGALTWVVTTEGANLAWVHKFKDNISIEAYIGKEWGEPISAGIVGRWEYGK